LQAYNTSFGKFPPGSRCTPASPKSDGPCFGSWAIYTLPYIEQGAVYSNLYNDSLPDFKQQAPFRTTMISTYVCPADPNGHEPAIPGTSGPAWQLKLQYSPGNYRGNSGLNDGSNQSFDRPVNAYKLMTKGKSSWLGPLAASNPLVGLLETRVASIVDGLSNTILIGEFTTTTELQQRAFWNYSYWEWSNSSVPVVKDPSNGVVHPPQPRVLLGDVARCYATRPFLVGPCKRGWSSMHAGNINFAFCDGSVHSISKSVDMQLLADLSTMAGGEPVSDPE
jgi:prepilin-type processing-associated H-X9-DG protein